MSKIERVSMLVVHTLFGETERELRDYASKLLNDPHEADEVVRSVFVDMLRTRTLESPTNRALQRRLRGVVTRRCLEVAMCRDPRTRRGRQSRTRDGRLL